MDELGQILADQRIHWKSCPKCQRRAERIKAGDEALYEDECDEMINFVLKALTVTI